MESKIFVIRNEEIIFAQILQCLPLNFLKQNAFKILFCKAKNKSNILFFKLG